MAKSKTKLNSNEIENFLKGSRELGDFLEFVAKPVEASVKRQVVRNNNKEGYGKTGERKEKNKDRRYAWDQKVVRERTQGNDRQKVEVRIEKAKFSDFKGLSIQKATDIHKRKNNG